MKWRKGWEWGGDVLLVALVQALLVPYQQLGSPRPPSGISVTEEAERLAWLLAPPPSWEDQRVRDLAASVGGRVEARVLTESFAVQPQLSAHASPRPYEPPPSWASPPPSLSNVAGPSRDLSLEEADLIDVLWRADADAEKGRFPTAFQQPELQHEQDMDLLTQKHLSRDFAWAPQSDENDPSALNRRFPTTAQPKEEYSAWTSLYAEDSAKASSVELLDENANKPTLPAVELTKTETAKPETEFDWGEWLEAGEKAVQEDACQAATNLEDFLSRLDSSGADELTGLLREEGGDVCLASAAVDPLDELSVDGLLGEGQQGTAEPLTLPLGFAGGDLDSIPTPSLDLSPMEVGQLFADQQVTQDVAASVSALEPSPSSSPTAVSGGTAMAGAWGSDVGFHRLRRGTAQRHRSAFSASAASDASGSTWVEALEGAIAYPDFAPESKEAVPTASSASPRQLASPALPSTPTLWLDHDYLDPTSPQSSGGSGSGPSGSGGDREEGKIRPSAAPRLGQRVKEEEDDSESPAERSRRAGRRSEDEALCSQHGLPFTPQDIVNMPLHVFQGLHKTSGLSSAQLEVIKKIRRRGKNKLAARNCRKRKTTTLDQLETENLLLQQELRVEAQHHVQLKEELAQEEAEVAALEAALGDLQ